VSSCVLDLTKLLTCYYLNLITSEVGDLTTCLYKRRFILIKWMVSCENKCFTLDLFRCTLGVAESGAQKNKSFHNDQASSMLSLEIQFQGTWLRTSQKCWRSAFLLYRKREKFICFWCNYIKGELNGFMVNPRYIVNRLNTTYNVSIIDKNKIQMLLCPVKKFTIWVR